MYQELIQNLTISLGNDRSSENRQMWTNYIFKEDIELIHLTALLDAEHPVGMRFTWLLGHIIEKDPNKITPIVSYCFENRDKWTFPGIKRTLAKMLWLAGVPEEIEGLVVDQLFQWILDPKVKVAVKVYGMDALYNMVLKYPDLKEELLIVIDDQWDKNSVAFRARGKRVLKALQAKKKLD
ncbi:MAG: Unknown protein [uncultured Aureispira sp.]|uniref:DNA alkylation repair enzyme n=1 Tax=uncultured Aureispira sp. TaxID=1331704 RepID=A0A6S6UNJ4_9BACT|nr:MAG: Unknown protein [uncultured Aureispira sp.]